MNIGLVLSGGMAKGAYQIGALRAINDLIPLNEIKYMSCASIGVLNGYAYATNHLDQAEQMWKNLCDNNTRYFINQILRSTILQQSITNLYDEEKKLSSTFYCSLLDLSHRNVIYKDLSTVKQQDIPLYLKASVAMPVYNKAIHLDNTAYFDGAVVDNIPVYPLTKHNFDYLICIYFDDICYKFENTSFDNRVIKITFPCKSHLKQSLILNQTNIEDMIKDGYNRTMYLLKPILSEGYDNLEYIYNTIHYLNQSNDTSNLRITGDVLVTNINKITQKLTKRKIL